MVFETHIILILSKKLSQVFLKIHKKLKKRLIFKMLNSKFN